MTVEIRFARPTEEDARAILDFVRELAEYEREPGAVKATVESILSQLEQDRPPFECLLAEDDGVPLGFALFFHSYSTWTGTPGLYLEDFYVPPGLRGRGIGDELMAALARIAVDRGCERMEWSVLNWNESAIRFYERRGAKPMDEWTTYRLSGSALKDAAKKTR